MSNIGVYIIRNNIDNRCYVGSSINLRKRKNEHIARLKSNTHRNVHINRFVNKYGIDSLFFEVLENTDVENLIEREQYWIDLLKPVFNISPTAKNCLGVKHTDETKRKVGLASKGRPFSEIHRQRLSQSLKGRVFSSETREKIRQSRIGTTHIGHKFSDESKVKMGKSQLGNTNRNGKKHSEEVKMKMKEAWIARRIKMNEKKQSIM